jgi:1-acyl-sn-glycerol-3-phosphate acyltransferase
MTVGGSDRVPSEGPLVVAANHFSHLDPVVVGLVVKRPMRYLAVDELYGANRVLGPLITWLGTIPLSRTRIPLGALRLALAELAAGDAVGLFPEGVRVWRWEERPPKRGAAWLAFRTGAPLLPIAITGTDEAMGRGTGRISRRPIHAEVCTPILPEEFAGHPDPVTAMTEVWRLRVDAVLRSWYEA